MAEGGGERGDGENLYLKTERGGRLSREEERRKRRRRRK